MNNHEISQNAPHQLFDKHSNPMLDIRRFRTTPSSRERNRIHARKTRQKKKEQLQTLRAQVEELKKDQIRLKLSIKEKNTATILVGLLSMSTSAELSKQNNDPRVELLLRRSVEDIPDASKITELPALVLSGEHRLQHATRDWNNKHGKLRNDGFNYELLGKDRSKCTPDELDQIRKERNRMHAKRARVRQQLFMEKMAEMSQILQKENSLLLSHLQSLDIRNPPRRSPSPLSFPITSTTNAEANGVSSNPDAVSTSSRANVASATLSQDTSAFYDQIDGPSRLSSKTK